MAECNGTEPEDVTVDSLFKFADPTGKGQIDFEAYKKIMTMTDEEMAKAKE